MKHYEFFVRFTTGIEVSVWAGCADDAIILAKANQIQAGNKHDIKDIWYYDKGDIIYPIKKGDM